MRPTFLRCWKLPRMVIGLRFNNRASFFDVSGNLKGEGLSKYYLVTTLPSSVPHPPSPHKADMFSAFRIITVVVRVPAAKRQLQSAHPFILTSRILLARERILPTPTNPCRFKYAAKTSPSLNSSIASRQRAPTSGARTEPNSAAIGRSARTGCWTTAYAMAP